MQDLEFVGDNTNEGRGISTHLKIVVLPIPYFKASFLEPPPCVKYSLIICSFKSIKWLIFSQPISGRDNLLPIALLSSPAIANTLVSGIPFSVGKITTLSSQTKCLFIVRLITISNYSALKRFAVDKFKFCCVSKDFQTISNCITVDKKIELVNQILFDKR